MHSVFDGTPRSSLIFPIDFLLLSFLHSQGMGCLNRSGPEKESVSDRETDMRWGEEKNGELKKKGEGENVKKKGRGWRGL